MALVFLSLGSNLGNRSENLEKAVSKIELSIGQVKLTSRIYESEAWGYESPNRFSNMILNLSTDLGPKELLYAIKKVEFEMGRKKNSKIYCDRLIDIDIIFYDKLILSSPELTIPHPLMHRRDFVLDPLNEIAPDFLHPVLNKTVGELYNSL